MSWQTLKRDKEQEANAIGTEYVRADLRAEGVKGFGSGVASISAGSQKGCSHVQYP